MGGRRARLAAQPDISRRMTDLPPAGFPTGADASEAPTFRVLAQFIRDLSFENPRAPESLRGQAQPPQIDLSVEYYERSVSDPTGSMKPTSSWS